MQHLVELGVDVVRGVAASEHQGVGVDARLGLVKGCTLDGTSMPSCFICAEKASDRSRRSMSPGLYMRVKAAGIPSLERIEFSPGSQPALVEEFGGPRRIMGEDCRRFVSVAVFGGDKGMGGPSGNRKHPVDQFLPVNAKVQGKAHVRVVGQRMIRR